MRQRHPPGRGPTGPRPQDRTFRALTVVPTALSAPNQRSCRAESTKRAPAPGTPGGGPSRGSSLSGGPVAPAARRRCPTGSPGSAGQRDRAGGQREPRDAEPAGGRRGGRSAAVHDAGLRARPPVDHGDGRGALMPSIGAPDRWLLGGERLTVGNRSWEVVHTPGHSDGHVCLWSASDRVLCSGDHLLQVVSPPV
ncbi:MBL fold metallo-hydrolase, partial [Pseudonocardia pini]|uniref:MBL fold metallo-hydrolase n=1 Tax=Pseudonocardia pini TaxID=2758030 RepID=UPI0015EFF817